MERREKQAFLHDHVVCGRRYLLLGIPCSSITDLEQYFLTQLTTMLDKIERCFEHRLRELLCKVTSCSTTYTAKREKVIQNTFSGVALLR